MHLASLPIVGRLFRAPIATGAGAGRRGLFVEQALDTTLMQLTVAEDPDYLLKKIGFARKDLAQLETDDEIFGALSTRSDALVSTPWRFEPTEGEVSKFLAEEMEKWADAIVAAGFLALPYGYSVAEAVYQKSEDGRIRLKQYGPKPMQWFIPQRDGTLRYLPPEGGPANGIEVDSVFKFFMTRHRATYRQPYGEALLSRLYWPWFFRYNGWRFWAEYLERFGLPFLTAAVPDPASFVSKLAEMGIDSVVAVAEGSTVSAIAASGAGEFEKFDSVICRRVQKLVLGQTLTTDVDGKGSYAAANVHDRVRQDKRNADVAMVQPTLQAVCNALAILNFGEGVEIPRVILEDETGLEPERAERDAKLVQSGAVRLTEQYFIRNYDFEEGDIEIPEPPPQGELAGGPPANGKGAPKKAAKASGLMLRAARFTRAQQEVEDLADRALAAVQSPIDPEAIRAAILAASDPEDLATRLAAVMREYDETEFREVLERALFAADVLGYVHADRPGSGA